MKYFFANWKENTTYPEAAVLVSRLRDAWAAGDSSAGTLVILPPTVFLIPLYNDLNGSSILLGVQNISEFEGGAHTGEISAKMVRPYAKYCLLGHSERRAACGETGQAVNRKIGICVKEGIAPLVCVSSLEQIPDFPTGHLGLDIFIVYEPLAYIGGEETQELGKIIEFSEAAKSRTGSKFIYGGSVNDKNATELLKEPSIDGLLVGHSSLDAEKFSRIISFPL